MIVKIINQDDIYVDELTAKKLGEALLAGTEFVVLAGELVRSSSISGIRTEKEELTTSRGDLQLLAGGDFFRDRREPKGTGYEKYLAMKKELLNRSGL